MIDEPAPALAPAYVALLHDSTLLPFRADLATIDLIAADWRNQVPTGAYPALSRDGAPFTLFLRFADVAAITQGELQLLLLAKARNFDGITLATETIMEATAKGAYFSDLRLGKLANDLGNRRTSASE